MNQLADIIKWWFPGREPNWVDRVPGGGDILYIETRLGHDIIEFDILACGKDEYLMVADKITEMKL